MLGGFRHASAPHPPGASLDYLMALYGAMDEFCKTLAPV